MKATINKTNGKVERWENCYADFLPTWLAIHFNNEQGLTCRTYAIPMYEITQVEIEYDNTED